MVRVYPDRTGPLCRVPLAPARVRPPPAPHQYFAHTFSSGRAFEKNPLHIIIHIITHIIMNIIIHIQSEGGI